MPAEKRIARGSRKCYHLHKKWGIVSTARPDSTETKRLKARESGEPFRSRTCMGRERIVSPMVSSLNGRSAPSSIGPFRGLMHQSGVRRELKMDFLDFIQRGGIAMYPIVFCSVLAVGVFFERLWALRGKRLIPEEFVRSLREDLRQGKLTDAAELCDRHASAPIARVARAALAQHGRGADMIRFTVSETGAQEALSLERYQYILGMVAYLCPLLGLFGTVSGMIKAFEVISRHTVVDPPLLAAGISEALVTTYAGLAVAIPAVVMDRYVQSRSVRLSQELEKQSVALAQELIGQLSEERSLKLLASSTR